MLRMQVLLLNVASATSDVFSMEYLHVYVSETHRHGLLQRVDVN